MSIYKNKSDFVRSRNLEIINDFDKIFNNKNYNQKEKYSRFFTFSDFFDYKDLFLSIYNLISSTLSEIPKNGIKKITCSKCYKKAKPYHLDKKDFLEVLKRNTSISYFKTLPPEETRTLIYNVDPSYHTYIEWFKAWIHSQDTSNKELNLVDKIKYKSDRINFNTNAFFSHLLKIEFENIFIYEKNTAYEFKDGKIQFNYFCNNHGKDIFINLFKLNIYFVINKENLDVDDFLKKFEEYWKKCLTP